jgi:hypothetical protein
MSVMPNEKPVIKDEKNEIESQTPPDTIPNNGNMIPKSRFDQVLQQKKDALAELETVAASLAEDVPEEFRDLIPNLSPAGQIGWLRNAQKKGLFDQRHVDGLDSERPKGGKPPLDTSNMSPMEMMSHGYK